MENDLLTNLNYFFSTSPQVLGAILAITGAYVVFKLESLKDGLNSYSQKMIDLWKPINEEELNKAMKKMELHEMIIENTDVK